MRSRISRAFLLFILVLGVAGWPLVKSVQGAVSPPRPIADLGVAVTENFDTLASTGTSDVTPTGWGFTESTADPDNYTADDGSSSAQDTYSYGSTASTERAFGSLSNGGASGGLNSDIFASFTNDTGATINSLTISYTGEKWRTGDPGGGADGFNFSYSTDATDMTDGTYIAVAALNYSAANSGTADSAVDGNANQTAVSSTITGLSIADGSTVFLRFEDRNGHGSGDEDGVAIDNFSLTAESDDDDADGEPDGTDNCANTDPNDTPIVDGCGYSQRPNDDDDSDGVDNGTDACPATDPNDTPIVDGCGYSQRPTDDDDGDGEPNATDTTCKTTDPNDTPIVNGCGYSERPTDDDDGDGEPNATDTTCKTTDPNDTPIVGGCGQSERPNDDDDSDTILNSADNCPDDANTDQADNDNDDVGDVCDNDDDNDTVDDGVDNCPTVANTTQDNFDNDAEGDACDADDDNDGVLDGDDDCDDTPSGDPINAEGCTDTDGDGVADTEDNCPGTANANQANNDNDALGDECDPDDDNDTVPDVDDDCPLVSGSEPNGCPPPAPPPTLTISDGTPARATPSSDCTLTVTRSGDLSGVTTVEYDTVDGSATAGKHYVAESGTLTFVADDASETIVIDVLKRAKRTKAFTVVLSDATNGTINDASGTCKIKRRA